MNQEKIGKFISECRKNKNITQEELAEKLGVTNRSVSRWENGKNMPDYSILKELCNILDIDVNEFLCGEKINKKEIESHTVENLDLILKEYYKMKKQRNIFKIAMIIIAGLLFYAVTGAIFALALVMGVTTEEEIVTNTNRYEEVIGENAKGMYETKWEMSEEIFPKSVKDLEVEDFKMYYYNSWDKQFLSYLVVDYSEEDYSKEVKRLKKIGIEDYKGIYGVTGFTKYKLLAMDSDDYSGFVYAITDGESKIIYVEMIFCNYYMEINYKKEIPIDYLPDGFDATEHNAYKKSIRK